MLDAFCQRGRLESAPGQSCDIINAIAVIEASALRIDLQALEHGLFIWPKAESGIVGAQPPAALDASAMHRLRRVERTFAQGHKISNNMRKF